MHRKDVRNPEISFGDWDELIEDPGKRKSLQLMVYAWLYVRQHEETQYDLMPGIISFRKPAKGLFPASKARKKTFTIDMINAFTEILGIIVRDIFDLEKSFNQAEDINNCKYCPFRGICNR